MSYQYDKAEMAILEREKNFIRKYGLKKAGAGFFINDYGWHYCLQKLLGKKCDGLHSECILSGFDHTSVYLYNSKPVLLLIQPYSVNPHDRKKWEEYADQNYLIVQERAEESWWYPGRTTAVFFWRKEFYNRLSEIISLNSPII